MEQMPDFGFPATDLAVTYRGESVYRRCVGYSDLDRTKPTSRDDIYYIFSVSKVVTCIGAIRLVEEGRLGLDDPVADYLPAFASPMVRRADGSITPAKNTMTVRHLFSMTAGLDYNLNSAPLQELRKRNPHFSTMEGVNAIAQCPLLSEPGELWRYSLCHDVLGAVIEAVTGERFSDYMHRVIFAPFGMHHTGYHIPAELLPRTTQMYTYAGNTMKPHPMEFINQYILSDNFDGGGAGLYSTVDDQIRFATVLANGGITEDGYRLLKKETIALLGEDQLTDAARAGFDTSRSGYSWGLCGRTHIKPLFSRSPSSLSEFGWDGAACAYILIDPEKQVAIYFGTEVRGAHFGYHTLHPLIRNFTYEALGL